MVTLGFIVAQIVGAVIVVGVLILVAFLWLQRKQYPLNVVVFEYRGAAARLRFDKARRVVKNGKEALQLKSLKDYVMPLNYLDAIVDTKGRTWYVLVQHAPKEYAPARVLPSTVEVEIDGKRYPLYQVIPQIDAAQKMAYSEAMELSYTTYHDKTFLEKAAPFIYIGLLLVMFIIGYQMMSNTLADIAKQLAPAIKQLAQQQEIANKLNQQLIDVIKMLHEGGKVVITQPPAAPPG